MDYKKKPPVELVLSLELSGRPPRDSKECREEVNRIYEEVKERRARLNRARKMNALHLNCVESYHSIQSSKGDVEKFNWMEELEK
tara:strand:- start:1763 stop:2017 length:255 start_codon:yes stop_codon:yes gene_type:complete